MDSCYRLLIYPTTLIFILFSSCKQPPVVQRGYYFWRIGNASSMERKFVKTHQIRKLYTKLMDVDWSEMHGPVPIAAHNLEGLLYEFKTYDSVDVEIIPVVFITNKIFERTDSEGLTLLAKRLVRRCLPAYDSMDISYERRNYITDNYRSAIRPKEIQFDCDWTVTTSRKYFEFLEKVKRMLPSDSITVSATIRLHQFTYPSKTGVPPVDRGMLMVYNLTDPKKYSTVNSIFDVENARPYFSRAKKYPLPLDIGLPAWSWCIIYRNREFYQIENELTAEELNQLSFLQLQKDGLYKVTQDTVFRELFLRPGDEIKAEIIDEQRLMQAAALADKAVNSDNYTISLFELSENEIKNYSSETIDKVLTGRD